MLPASLTKNSVYAKKLRGWEQRKTTSHWPNTEVWFRERPTEVKRVRAFTAFTAAAANQPAKQPALRAAGCQKGRKGQQPPQSNLPAAELSRAYPVLATKRQRLLHGLERYDDLHEKEEEEARHGR